MERYHFDDLTKINCPFGLLDEDTQERLKAWPHGHEFLCGYNACLRWVDASPHWSSTDTYRAKPAPLTKPHIPYRVFRALARVGRPKPMEEAGHRPDVFATHGRNDGGSAPSHPTQHTGE